MVWSRRLPSVARPSPLRTPLTHRMCSAQPSSSTWLWWSRWALWSMCCSARRIATRAFSICSQTRRWRATERMPRGSRAAGGSCSGMCRARWWLTPSTSPACSANPDLSEISSQRPSAAPRTRGEGTHAGPVSAGEASLGSSLSRHVVPSSLSASRWSASRSRSSASASRWSASRSRSLAWAWDCRQLDSWSDIRTRA